MASIIQLVTQILTILTIASQIGIILFLLLLLSRMIYKKNRNFQKLLEIIKKKAILICFIVTLTATLGSLFFSEIAHYQPCELCWFQRIFMYPQTLILGIALWKKDRSVARYVIPMSVIGALIGGYQYIKSAIVKAASAGTCAATGPSCFVDYFKSQGYVTIPLMAFTAFIIVIVMAFWSKKDKR